MASHRNPEPVPSHEMFCEAETAAEVLFVWLRLGIRNRYAPVLPAVERFLLAMGRRKFAQPLYQALVQEGDWGRPVAERVYARARPGYHAVTTGPIDRILRGQPAG